jgi:hypothetical protein
VAPDAKPTSVILHLVKTAASVLVGKVAAIPVVAWRAGVVQIALLTIGVGSQGIHAKTVVHARTGIVGLNANARSSWDSVAPTAKPTSVILHHVKTVVLVAVKKVAPILAHVNVVSLETIVKLTSAHRLHVKMVVPVAAHQYLLDTLALVWWAGVEKIAPMILTNVRPKMVGAICMNHRS